jgi:uncharacterized integral membrane protein
MVASPSSLDSQSGGKRSAGERHTRLSGALTALVTGVLALVVILVFNLQSVDLSFLVFHGRLPLAIALLFGCWVPSAWP